MGGDIPAAVERNVGRGAVLVELNVQRGGVGVEVQAARHAVVGALVGVDVGHAVGLEQAADQQAVDADVGVPGRHARRVAKVEALVAVLGRVHHAVVAHPLGRVVVVDVASVECDLVHLVLDGPLWGEGSGLVGVCFQEEKREWKRLKHIRCRHTWDLRSGRPRCGDPSREPHRPSCS